MRKIVSMFLICLMLFSLIIPIPSSAISEVDDSLLEEKTIFISYVNLDMYKVITDNSLYCYMDMVNNLDSSSVFEEILELSGGLLGTSVEPTKEEYVEVLSNIILIYEYSNVDAVLEQNILDNTKTGLDYTVDVAIIAADAIGVFENNSALANDSEMIERVTDLIELFKTTMESTDELIETVSKVETTIQNYSNNVEFLTLVKENSTGELKEAAMLLLDNQEECLAIKFDAYLNYEIETISDYSEILIGSDVYSIIEKVAGDDTQGDVYNWIRLCDGLIEAMPILGDSWDLGKAIGALVGNVVVGGEDLIYRVVELRALSDISTILTNELHVVYREILAEEDKQEAAALIENFVKYTQYLVGCRIRGEYIVYSIVASDSGLISWFNKSNAEEVLEWYETKETALEDIYDGLKLMKERIDSIETEGADEYVKNIFEYKGVCESDGKEFEINIPTINIESADASQINKEILEDFDYENLVNNCELYIEGRLDSYDAARICDTLTYEWSVNGDVLSILIIKTYVEMGATEYFAYNIDITNGEELENEEILSLKWDGSMTEYDNLIRSGMIEQYCELFSVELSDIIESSNLGYEKWIQSELEISLQDSEIEKAKLFINHDGELCVVAICNIPAQYSIYPMVINLTDTNVNTYEEYLKIMEQAKSNTDN